MSRVVKNLFAGLAAMLALSSAATGQITFWEKMTSPHEGNISSVVVDSGYRIFVFASDGGIFSSVDQGVIWTPLRNGLPSQNILGLQMNSRGHLYSNTETGLFQSTDHGQQWQRIGPLELQTRIRAVGIGAGDKMLAATDKSIHLSLDDGVTWHNITSNYPKYAAYQLVLNNKGDFFISTHNSGIYRSTDSGISWQEINSGLISLYGGPLAFNSKGHLFLGTYTNGLFLSTDNGEHWQESNGENTRSLLVNSVIINASDHVYAAGSSGVFVSKNNGLSWAVVNTGLTGYSANALAIDRQGYIYAGTNGGGVYRSVKSTQTGVVPSSQNHSPRPCELVGSFPNPFNHSTCIRYALPQPAMIDIDILDLNGRQVEHLWSGFCEAGHHQIRWNAANTGSGIYQCRLKTGKEISFIKMLLVK